MTSATVTQLAPIISGTGPVYNPGYPPNLERARALTLQNPWAHAISHHGKDVENRGWSPPSWLDFMYIHAGKAWGNAGLAQLSRWDLSWESAATSAIVAVASIHHICDAAMRDQTCGCGRWAMPDQKHWKLATIWTLTEPVRCGGKQGLWAPSETLVDAVRANLP